ncbi:hypothetical protein BH23ACT2_BH23ACT2_16510 [soil metagenome]
MDLRTRQQLNRGYADTLARGFEFVLVPLIFGGLGWLVDGWLGTGRLVTVALVVFGFVGMTFKLWLSYDAAMKREEQGAVWSRGPTGTAAVRPTATRRTTARPENGEGR